MPCTLRCERTPHVIYPERFAWTEFGQNNGTGPCVTIIKKFLKDETAATAIEYGLIAAGIALAIIAVVNGLGSKLSTKFTAINSSLK
jgi:pilus assembly protein Flp/PilA